MFREDGEAGEREWVRGRVVMDSVGREDEAGEGDAEAGEGASCGAAEEVQRVGEESGVMCLFVVETRCDDRIGEMGGDDDECNCF